MDRPINNEALSGVLSPFVYNNNTDLEEQEDEHVPLLPPPPKSPSENILLRRELFGELAETTVNPSKADVCCCASCSIFSNSFLSITTLRPPNEQALDGFRALAFLWILSFHVGISFKEVSTANWRKLGWLYQDLDAWHIPLNGDMGVDIFLVISGYLACGSWSRVHAKMSGPRSKHSSSSFCKKYGRYMLQRFIRLAPLLYALIGLSSLFEPVLSGNPNENPCDEGWVVHVFFVSNFYTDQNNGFQCADHTWTVAMLMQLAMVTPFVVLLSDSLHNRCSGETGGGSSDRRGRRGTSSVETIQWLAKGIVPGLLVVLCTVARAAIIRQDIVSKVGENQFHMSLLEEETSVGFTHPLYRGAPYFSGVCVYMLYCHGMHSAHRQSTKFRNNVGANNELLLGSPGSTASRQSSSRSRGSSIEIKQLAISRLGNVCGNCCVQVCMFVLLIAMCIIGVGTHRTFGVRRQAWVEWMHSSTDPMVHELHAVLGRPVFGLVISYWLVVVSNGRSVIGVSTLLSWRGFAPIARLSYGAYIFTYLSVFLVVPHFVVEVGETLNPDGWRVRAIFVASFTSVFLLLMVIAYLLYTIIEMPMYQYCSCQKQKKMEPTVDRRGKTRTNKTEQDGFEW